jgi:hypothetical protein
MKLFLLTAALILSTSVYAQDASKPPTGGGKSAARMKPKALVGCTLVGTKLWAPTPSIGSWRQRAEERLRFGDLGKLRGR